MAAFLANVGVNAGHAARSPLFDDGSFELLPVPERRQWRPPMVKLSHLARLEIYAPRSWHDLAVHADPDLRSATPTYGDNCRTAGRAFSLRRAQAGDLIVFLARLHARDGKAAFHLVGFLEIDDAITDVTHDPGPGWWDGNAHVRRARATDEWNAFWVFAGTARSRLFARAAPFTRSEMERVLGPNITWRSSRTELQTIGSYTRAVRRVEGQGEEWLRATCLS